VQNKEVLHRVRMKRNIPDIRKQRKANCIGHILCTNCIPKYIIEEQIEDEKTRKKT
jgi:hypothetical protein